MSEPIGFYRWYASPEGTMASREEKRKRAAAYVRHVQLPLWCKAHPGREKSPEARRYHKRLLQHFYHCIDTDTELPPEPRYPLVRTEAPRLPADIEGL